MSPKFILFDNLENSGQYIPLTQGESRTITFLLQKADGTPMVIPTASYDEILVNIYKGVSAASIIKRLSLASVTAVISTQLGGLIGFSFSLTGAETAAITANNSGVPVKAQFSLSSVPGIEMNFAQPITVDVPVVQN